MLIKHRKKTDSGFTLIEVLVVIAIIGLIAAIGTPSFNDWRQNANVSADMRRLYGFFQKARIEAVKQNKTCSINLTATDYVSTVDGVVIDSGNYSVGVTMVAPVGGFNASFSSRGLISANTKITLQNSINTQHNLIINTRGRMRIQ